MGFISMEPEDTPPTSGSNAICVATVLLDAGILPMQEPETHLMLEAPGGLIAVTAECRNGKAERASQSKTCRPSPTSWAKKVPSFADKLDAPLEVKGMGSLKIDIAYGGDSFAIVDAAALGFAVRPDEARDLAEMGVRIIDAANEQFGFSSRNRRLGPYLLLPVRRAAYSREERTSRLERMRYPPRQDRPLPDRDRLQRPQATLSTRGLMAEGDIYRSRPMIGSEFVCRIARRTAIGSRPAIVPIVSGRAWITGVSQYMLDPDDPWPAGYRLADTWPRLREAIWAFTRYADARLTRK